MYAEKDRNQDAVIELLNKERLCVQRLISMDEEYKLRGAYPYGYNSVVQEAIMLYHLLVELKPDMRDDLYIARLNNKFVPQKV